MRNYYILAVDDEPFNLDLIEASFIEYNNIIITYALSGAEALELLEKKDFHVVLLDISMPKMDGLEVLRKIRSTKKYAQLPVLIVTANIEKEKEALELGASDFISKPYDVNILCARTINYARLHSLTKQVKNQNIILEEKVQERTFALQEALQLSKETEFEISTRLGRAGESRDPETGGHIKRMSHYSKLLAELYGLDKEECELILYAAPLHDIGKIAIKDAILLKPGPFEPDEYKQMQEHAYLGALMLEGADRYPVLKAGHIIALEHHEKYDGTGYPNGKKGKDIHLYARIIAIADVFDALNSKRCYKESMPLEKVLTIMKKDTPSHFDPELMKIFLDNLEKFLEIKEIFKDENCQPLHKEVKIQSEKKLSILFVDDNELNRILITEMLGLLFPNITITSKENASQALKSDLSQYSLILTDIIMPNIDGYEFYTLLRNEKAFSGPVIAITGLDSSEDKDKIFQHGFDDYISKPLDIHELENSIKRFL
jgi:putative two-component system response regulator